MTGPSTALTIALALALSAQAAATAAHVAFVDGLWQGGIETGPSGNECWAAMTGEDGTTLTLAERGNVSWYLRLTNPGWQLPSPHRYDMLARVDFYPRLRITAEASDPTRLEIDDLDGIALLTLIENGHAIELSSDGFSGTYTLEGSAKIIERLRTCATSAATP